MAATKKVRKDTSLTAAEEKAVIAWAESVRITVLQCRQFGHSWRHGLTEVYVVAGDLIRQIQCDRCHMVRRDVVPLGEYGAARRAYIPPSDYRRDDTFGSTRVPRWAIADGLVARSEQKEPDGDLLDWYYKRSRA